MAYLDEATRTWEANAVFEMRTEISETLQGIDDFMSIREWEKERAAERAALTRADMPSPPSPSQISAPGRPEVGDGAKNDEPSPEWLPTS